jgi:hypothetical protein
MARASSLAFEKKMNGFFAQSTGYFALADQLSREQLEKHPDAIDAYEEIRFA